MRRKLAHNIPSIDNPPRINRQMVETLHKLSGSNSGDAKVQNVEISNLPFALFSITTSAAFYFNVPRKAAMFLT